MSTRRRCSSSLLQQSHKSISSSSAAHVNPRKIAPRTTVRLPSRDAKFLNCIKQRHASSRCEVNCCESQAQRSRCRAQRMPIESQLTSLFNKNCTYILKAECMQSRNRPVAKRQINCKAFEILSAEYCGNAIRNS